MTDTNFTFDELVKYIPVSRETHGQLENYVNLLKKWQKKINLVSNATISDIWKRHIIDSAQLMRYLETNDSLADIGSGAGFPGMVLAILGIQNITLVESDIRKAVFLKESAREIGININVLSQRVENVSLDGFSVFTARAFASIKDILALLNIKLNAEHKILLLKGKNWNKEIEEARYGWSFDYESFPSLTGEGGMVLVIKNILQKGNMHAKPV